MNTHVYILVRTYITSIPVPELVKWMRNHVPFQSKIYNVKNGYLGRHYLNTLRMGLLNCLNACSRV